MVWVVKMVAVKKVAMAFAENIGWDPLIPLFPIW